MNKQTALKELERIDKLHEKGIIGNLEHNQMSREIIDELNNSLKKKLTKQILGKRR